MSTRVINLLDLGDGLLVHDDTSLGGLGALHLELIVWVMFGGSIHLDDFDLM